MTTQLAQTRIWKRDLDLRYTGAVHNRLAVHDGVLQEKVEVGFKHFGYGLTSEKMAAKQKRSVDILKKQLEENPNNAFALWNMANHHQTKDSRFNFEMKEQVAEWSMKAAKLTDLRGVPGWTTHVMSNNLAAWALMHSGRFKEAEKFAMQALRYKADYVDAQLVLAYILRSQGKYADARKWFNIYLRTHETLNDGAMADGVIITYKDHIPDAQVGLATCSEQLGDIDEAIMFYMSALHKEPTRRDAYFQLSKMYAKGQITEEEWVKTQKVFVEPAPKEVGFYNDIYDKPYDTDRYKPIYEWIVEVCRGLNRSVTEVGCGTGALAAMMNERRFGYRGFDYSKQAIKVAKSQSDARLFVADAFDKSQYETCERRTIVMTELLEHLDDFKLLAKIPTGAKIVASVPNFGDPAHLRVYPTPEHIVKRFKNLIEIKEIRSFGESGNVIFAFVGTKK